MEEWVLSFIMLMVRSTLIAVRLIIFLFILIISLLTRIARKWQETKAHNAF